MRKLWNGDNPNIPESIREIALRMQCVGYNKYRLCGDNSARPAYGIFADCNKLQQWAQAHCNDIRVLGHNGEPHNYYSVIELPEPIICALEGAGYLK